VRHCGDAHRRIAVEILLFNAAVLHRAFLIEEGGEAVDERAGTLPAEIGDIAYQNKAVIYDLLFKASAETTLTIAADPKHLGARIGFMSVPHTWGSALTHHPHVHMVVPGGGLSPDGSTWIACRPRYFLTVQVPPRIVLRNSSPKPSGRFCSQITTETPDKGPSPSLPPADRGTPIRELPQPREHFSIRNFLLE